MSSDLIEIQNQSTNQSYELKEDFSLSNKNEKEILRQYIKNISQFPMLSQEEEVVLMDQYTNNGDHEAGKKIIMSHLRLTVKIAMIYKNYGLSMMEIISEGNIGLMHALEKFDIKKNVRFSTYAMLWIKATIQDFILKSWSMVKVGSIQLRKKLIFNSSATKKLLGIAQNDANSDEKIANYLNVDIQDYHDAKIGIANRDNILLSDTNNSDDSSSDELSDKLANKDDNLGDMIEKEEHDIQIHALQNAFKRLSDREKYIIFHRYIQESKLTLDVLSNKLGISKERVRQIEESAIKKMKNLKDGKW